jgi:hypothetical protein
LIISALFLVISFTKSNSSNNSGSNKDTSSLLHSFTRKWYIKEVIDYNFTGLSLPPDTTIIIHNDYYDFLDGVFTVNSWFNAYLTLDSLNASTFYAIQDSEYTSSIAYCLQGSGIIISSGGLTDTLSITQINDTGMVLYQDINPGFPYWDGIKIYHR